MFFPPPVKPGIYTKEGLFTIVSVFGAFGSMNKLYSQIFYLL
jgi:hypothetical protein